MHDNPTQAVLYAYLAGIIDGEGSITIRKVTSKKTLALTKRKSPWYHPAVSLGMMWEGIPALLYDTFGGSCYTERAPSHRTLYRWALMGNKQIVPVLKALLPYLRVKQEQALMLLEFLAGWVDLRTVKGEAKIEELQRREDLYQQMRKLNAVGAAATTKRDDIREDEAIV